MTIELKPEQEQRIAEAIRSGAYQSSWELTAGSSSKEKPTVTRAVTVATRQMRQRGLMSGTPFSALQR
ncbi:MAG: hypothetical protein ABSE93_16640 [Terriglobia bacterium]|jgi:hypothetical protein